MAKKLTGVVVSDVQDKTVVVTVTRRVTHPIYGKKYTVSRKVSVHDEKNEAKIGDRVEIVETRPISRNKHFTLNRIVTAGHGSVELRDESQEEQI